MAMTNAEFKSLLEVRTRNFAVSVFRVLDSLPQVNSVRVVGHQLGKSASSVGANYREANRAESGGDFKHKIGIVLKECAESGYWLDILQELFPRETCIKTLHEECIELLKLFCSISKTIGTSTKCQHPTPLTR